MREGAFLLSGRLAPGTELTIRRAEGRCGIEHGRAHPGLAKCRGPYDSPGVIDTTGELVRDEVSPPSELPPARVVQLRMVS